MFSFTIRKKIWISFGALVALLITVGVIAHANLKANKDSLSTLVGEIQPAMELSLNLVDQLDRASASLGFYLLSKESGHKNDYINTLKKVSKSADDLSAMPAVKKDKVTVDMIRDVKQGIAKLLTYKERMLEYASNESKNIPAMDFAGKEVNPRAQVLMQNLQEMLQSESGEKVTDDRRTLMVNMYEMRGNLSSAINELRIFLAFRAKTAQDNFVNYTDLVGQGSKKINEVNSTLLTFEQQIAMESFNKTFPEWSAKANELMKIHGAEDWRQDAYVIRKELSPLVLKIQERLNQLVKNQQATSVRSSEGLTAQVLRTQNVVGGLILLGMVCAILIGLYLTRAITNPIDALKANAAELARGNLDQAIDTKRKDELGNLARSFADMRDAIKKKLEDLHSLNHTGQTMAGMHDPIQVLEHALMVMGQQTDVEWGSVYLYNKEAERLEVKTYYPKREEAGEERSARTFQLGQGATGRAALEKHIVYIPDTSKGDPFELEPGDDATPRAIICVPMVDNDEIFGVMNFCGKVGTVKFSDSDQEFAETISRMAVVSFKNIHMLNVIEEQNRTLEQKVEERTAQLRQKTNDINNMLQSMHQGIFTVLPGRTIHPEYSAYLETIVETKHIANTDVMTLLFSDTSLGSNALSQISAALDAILGEESMMFDFNRHCLVPEFNKTMPDGRVKILELDWDPIVGENDVIEKLMVTVRDVTELRGLQAEAEKQKWELEVIGQILAVSPDKFIGFTKDALRFLNENEQLIQENAAPSAEAISTLFRNMHTIKGNARTYGFTAITDVAHEAETTYDVLRKSSDAPWDKDKMLGELQLTRKLVQTYDAIFKDKLSGASSEGVFVDTILIDLLKGVLASVNENDAGALRKALNSVKSITGAIGTESLPSILDAITKSIPELAEKLGKIAPNIVINDHGIRFSADVVPIMKNVFTHSFRNAIDHGLEPAEERKAHGKPDQGTIHLELSEEDGQIVLSLSDDGRGLAIKRLKSKAMEAGLLDSSKEITDKMLAELIFHSGLSTAENLSDISGRGVGMDAIRSFVEKLGGTVEIRFTSKSLSDDDYRQFVSRITLPATYTVKVA
jgi:HAMP domain-containing protein/HPt (histidine-containing phosphotransfer) domain-containing protein/CHASE3 domain sensor protein